MGNITTSVTDHYQQRLEASATYLMSKAGAIPEIALILGSGLGEIADNVESATAVPFSEIPGLYPAGYESTVPGHKKEFVVGSFAGRRIIVQSGRMHTFEGLSAADVALPVRALARAGVRTFIISNAAGGINPDFKVGDLMFLTNHVSFGIQDPSVGVTHPNLGDRFYDVTHPYDPELIERGIAAARDAGLRAHRGAYVMTPGPRYETASEIAILAALGKLLRDQGLSDLAPGAVGMSTVPEVNALRNFHQRSPVRILAFSLITNLGAGIGTTPLSHEEVQAAGTEASRKLVTMMSGLIPRL